MLTRSKRQREILNFISGYQDANGYQPSYSVIAREFNLSSRSTVAKHIVALEQQGYLMRHRESGSFSLELKSTHSGPNALCEIEWISQENYKESTENVETEKLLVPKLMIGFLDPNKIAAYRVTNDAMIDDHICEDDIALIEKRSLVRDGSCVLALIEKERFVLKRYFRSGKKIELRPSNRNYDSVVLTADKVSIKGIFRGLLRPVA